MGTFSDLRARFSRAMRFLVLTFVLFPLQGKIGLTPTPGTPTAPSAPTQNTKVLSQSDANEDDETETEAEYDLVSADAGEYFVNNSSGIIDGGILVEGKKNYYLKPNVTGPALIDLFTKVDGQNKLQAILQIFKPEITTEESRGFVERFEVLAGEDIDHYLEVIRKGSWGTTLLTVNENQEINFGSISLRRFLLEPSYQDNERHALQNLALEEFFQAQQYQAVVADLYNQGYLKAVASIDSPAQVTTAVAVGNLRAFLELPQQQALTEMDLGANSYNYYVGDALYAGAVGAKKTVNKPYQALVNFIEQKLEISTSSQTLLHGSEVKEINEAFRRKYLEYYQQRGFSDEQIQIWNLIGLKRNNRRQPQNSLDLKPILSLPTPLSTASSSTSSPPTLLL